MTEEEQLLAVGGPHGIPRVPERRGEAAGLAAAGGHQVELAAVFGRAHPVGEPFAVGREARGAAARHEQARFAAGHRDRVDAAFAALGAEGERKAVGREGGAVIVGVAGGEAARGASGEGVNPEV